MVGRKRVGFRLILDGDEKGVDGSPTLVKNKETGTSSITYLTGKLIEQVNFTSWLTKTF